VKNYLGAKLINPGLTPEDCIGGIYHFSNSGIASWYDFAFEIQNLALKKGILKSPKPIIPIATEDYPLPAPRPNYSVLDLTESRIQYSIPHWRDALERMMSELN
jgi:dTDP-4-dehydrorhamnose reductase